MWDKLNRSIKFRIAFVVTMLCGVGSSTWVVIEARNDASFISGIVALVLCSVALIVNSLVLYMQISKR